MKKEPEAKQAAAEVYDWAKNSQVQRMRNLTATKVFRTDPLSIRELPSKPPDPWAVGPDSSFGSEVWRQSDMVITEQFLIWLKRFHTIEWGASRIDTRRPSWVVSVNAHWWCLCCGKPFPSILTVCDHCVRPDHWERRRDFEFLPGGPENKKPRKR